MIRDITKIPSIAASLSYHEGRRANQMTVLLVDGPTLERLRAAVVIAYETSEPDPVVDDLLEWSGRRA